MNKKIVILSCLMLVTAFTVVFPIINVSAAEKPVANFSYTPLNPVKSEIVEFFDLSTDADGIIVKWWWDFGDGYYSDLQNPIHVYYENGEYTVSLRVTDDNSTKDTMTKTILVNTAPDIPSNPDPADAAIDVDINYCALSWTSGDADGDPVTYDVYFGVTNPPPLVSGDQIEDTYTPGLMEFGVVYYWKIVAKDDKGATTQGPVWSFTTGQYVPTPPNVPARPHGPFLAWVKSSWYYRDNVFSTMTVDPNNDQVFYMWDWGDGIVSDWMGPYNSGEVAYATHLWAKKGTYYVKVKAKDIGDLESDWSSLTKVYARLG